MLEPSQSGFRSLKWHSSRGGDGPVPLTTLCPSSRQPPRGCTEPPRLCGGREEMTEQPSPSFQTLTPPTTLLSSRRQPLLSLPRRGVPPPGRAAPLTKLPVLGDLTYLVLRAWPWASPSLARSDCASLHRVAASCSPAATKLGT